MNGDNREFGPPRDPAYTERGWVGPAPQLRPRRRNKTVLVAGIILIGSILLCGLGAVAILASSAPKAGGDPIVESSNYANKLSTSPPIVLTVEGIGKADISFNINGSGGSETDAVLPWTRTLGPFDGLVVASMVAQDKTGSSKQKITAKISFGEKSFPCEAIGAYAVATCTGTYQ
jgi:hypothetical protein